MKLIAQSIRSFIGAKNFQESRQFYSDLGFEELVLSPEMSYFRITEFGFYLQDYYVKDWVENSMLFLEVEQLEKCRESILELNLPLQYKNVRISDIAYNDWGNEFFLHDPSGILWHIGEFSSKVDYKL